MTGVGLHWLHFVIWQGGAPEGPRGVRRWGLSCEEGEGCCCCAGALQLVEGVCGQFSSEVSTGPRLQLPADILVAPFVSYKLPLNPRVSGGLPCHPKGTDTRTEPEGQSL